MATHSSVLAWRPPRTEAPGGLLPWGPKESDMTERLTLKKLCSNHGSTKPCYHNAVLFFFFNKYLYVHHAQDSAFSCEHTSSLVNKV